VGGVAPSVFCGINTASVMSGMSSTVAKDKEEDEEEGSVGVMGEYTTASTGFSVGMLLGDGLFFWL
jgi:hypothetical protein